MGETLRTIARAAGLATEWTDFAGQRRKVSNEVLTPLVEALGVSSVPDMPDRRPPMIVCRVGESLSLATRGRLAQLTLEDGTKIDWRSTAGRDSKPIFRVPTTPGYHHLELSGHSSVLAIAPRRAWTIADLAPNTRLWGPAVQTYGLRGGGTHGFGDFGALADFAGQIATKGADAVAISPAQSLFPANLTKYSPYSPSSRLFLNGAFADLSLAGLQTEADSTDSLIDWERALARKKERLRQAFNLYRRDPGWMGGEFGKFVVEGGERLIAHARFEALEERFSAITNHGWRNWPAHYRSAQSPETQALSIDEPEVAFHLYVQWITDRSLANAQRRGLDAGMAIGLIWDLPVGMDRDGSHGWSRPNDLLQGVSVGAPPDLLNQNGQNWALSTFSPHSLMTSGFDAYLATLRAAMRNCGGIRIDHAMGLCRLWVIPDGAPPADGTYLNFPFKPMLQLLALESVRHGTIVVGEDLGTVPEGFRARTEATGMLGMQVLWFERTKAGGFKSPARWKRKAAAFTSTHDLSTIAGWWRGRDIDWRYKLGAPLEKEDNDRRVRSRDRNKLWKALVSNGCATGPQPALDRPQPVVDGAIRFVARTPCPLAIIPVEDLIGLEEQPNLPATIDEHPNWRRRLSTDNAFEKPEVQTRLRELNDTRPPVATLRDSKSWKSIRP